MAEQHSAREGSATQECRCGACLECENRRLVAIIRRLAGSHASAWLQSAHIEPSCRGPLEQTQGAERIYLLREGHCLGFGMGLILSRWWWAAVSWGVVIMAHWAWSLLTVDSGSSREVGE